MGPVLPDRCQTCRAVVNPAWETCAACRRPLTSHEITIEQAALHARPVYWERGDTSIVGPGTPEFLARVGQGPKASYWVIALYQGGPVWINSMILRSQQAFETQILPTVCTPIHDANNTQYRWRRK